MKHRPVMLLSYCAIALVLLTNASSAQSYANSISADPLSLAFHVFNATYEHRVSPMNSFTIFGSYFTFVDWTAYGVGASYRWYFNINDGKNPLAGLSAGPVAAFSTWTWDGAAYWGYEGGGTFSIGGQAAYKWIFGGFVLEPNVMILFQTKKLSGLDWSPFGIGVNLGYAW